MQAGLDLLGRSGDEWYTPPAAVQTATVNGQQAWFCRERRRHPTAAAPPTVHPGA